ncbi:MAG TPA: 23S rRNA (adenine(2030)-N(6))-methyltransferase RlmJ, partial [Mariprofundaceae bacterium]|nr:23S rRNA (adenine(2030)-N(6))-methyltransferase RlmJ [Mariprofundaceae bacterium]
MNYRHAYHAGNFADVFKHVILMLLVEHLRDKDKPFTVIDTHAGIGMYDLAGEEAQKTREYEGGVMRLMAASSLSPTLARFRQLVADIAGTDGGDLDRYPGSPRIARSLLRDGDRLQLVELHPEDVQTLRSGFARDHQAVIHA